MKEILKYLRQTNSFTQEEIAHNLRISRQSYIKYEKGEVEPGEEIIRNLSIIYNVPEFFIRKNEIPKPGEEITYPQYEVHNEILYVTEPAAVFGASPLEPENLSDGRKVFEGFFDGTAIRILNSIENLKLKKGQKLKLYIEMEEEEENKRKASFEKFMDLARSAKLTDMDFDDDPYYKKAINAARDEYFREKYES